MDDFPETFYYDKVCWFSVYETTGSLPGLVPGCQSLLSLYLCIVLISANEVNLCQDLTNYLLLEVTRPAGPEISGA